MFDDVEPPQLVRLVHAEQPQHLEQQRQGRARGAGRGGSHLEREEHGDPAHQVPADDGRGPDPVPGEAHERLLAAGVHQAVLHEDGRGQHAEQPAPAVNSHRVHRVVHPEAEQRPSGREMWQLCPARGPASPGQDDVDHGGREGDDGGGPGVVAVTPRADGDHAWRGGG